MNWFERIEAARKRGYFTYDDRLAANEWPTCACGEQDEAIPRAAGHGRPRDPLLRVFGGQFAQEVASNEFGSALATLHQIEQRATEVLEEIAYASR